MANETLHHNVLFAKKYGDPAGSYLNAFNALTRAETLLEDAQRIESVLDSVLFESDHWMLVYGTDIVSYYAVGFVTCLEWHARSRMADLATHAPSALLPEDLKGQVGEKMMIQLLKQGASVANLLSAATKVNTLERYLGIFKRLLEAVGAPKDVCNILSSKNPTTGELWLTESEIDELESLFTFRHQLVHEIGPEVEDHPWEAKTAVSYGALVLRLMRALETAVTSYAPEGFPNLLDETFSPVGRVDYLNAEIGKLEEQILKIFETRGRANDPSKEEWFRALEASRAHRELENHFIRGTPILQANHLLDLTGPLEEKLAQSRHDYLQLLIQHAERSFDFPEDIEEPSSAV